MKSLKSFINERCWPGYKPRPGKKAYEKDSCMKEDLRNWFNPNHPDGGWKRINSKGEAIGPCAREPGEAKPKCMSNKKRAQLSKKERASAVASKRRNDPNPERKGAPINVSNFGKGKISESMEKINEKNVPTSPEKWAQAKAQAKAKFDVYPSAYANGWASKKYKEMGGGWKSESTIIDDAAKYLQENEVSEMFDLVEEMVMNIAHVNNVDPEVIWEDFETISDEELYEVAAWQRKEGKSEAGGLNRKGIESYRRENPGSKLSMAVTTKPSKLKPGSKAANRRKSFCARMGGMKKRLTSAKTANDPDSRINKALRKWNC